MSFDFSVDLAQAINLFSVNENSSHLLRRVSESLYWNTQGWVATLRDMWIRVRGHQTVLPIRTEGHGESLYQFKYWDS